MNKDKKELLQTLGMVSSMGMHSGRAIELMRDVHGEQGPYLDVGYLLHEGDNSSKENLFRNRETGQRGETREGHRVLDRIIDTIRHEGGNIASINTNEPTLEDVFLSVTGKQMRDTANEKAASSRRRHGPWGAPRARVR